jgi:hypothetical protein
MKKRHLIIFNLLTLIFTNTYAIDRSGTCRQASNTYKFYGSLHDKLFSELKKEKDKNQFNYIFKYIKDENEKFKDSEYKKLYDVTVTMRNNKDMDSERLDAWRMYMEASIDIAYILAAENMISDNLGKSEDYYARKIFDRCMGFQN